MLKINREIINAGTILAVDLGFSATVADPLMKSLVGDNIGVHFFGKDRLKLHQISIAACSVSSDPSLDIHEWSTPMRVEMLATQYQNRLFCLECLENFSPKKETSMTAWSLGEGKGKETFCKPACRWSNAFLSTESVGVPEHIANTGRKVYQGEMIRMLHIPIDYII